MVASQIPRTALGVGLGWRRELAGGLLGDPAAVELIEVVAESCFSRGPRRREAQALAELWPVIPHGVKLSLGSASGIDRERASQLGHLARELRAPFITEHVAFTSAGGREIGHLTPLPLTQTAIDVVARNVAAARRLLPDVPLLLENAAWTLRWPEDAIDEGSFYHEIVERTGCALLLDLGNVYANACNSGVDPLQLLRSYPLDRVGMIHLAGGSVRHGFYIDTHAHPVPAPVLTLLAAALLRCGRVPIIVERDALFPPFAELIAEVKAARAVLDAAAAAPRPGAGRPRATPPAGVPASRQALAVAQAALCELLVAPQPATENSAFELAAITRTREVLQAKRVDDALPLLSHLGERRAALWPLAYAALLAAPRAAFGTAIADAFRIAGRAAAEREFAAAARRDQLLLRSRFVAYRDGRRQRRGPFIGSVALPDGRQLWAWKGVGSAAATRVFIRGGAAAAPPLLPHPSPFSKGQP